MPSCGRGHVSENTREAMRTANCALGYIYHWPPSPSPIPHTLLLVYHLPSAATHLTTNDRHVCCA